ncbi:MAG: hypothetical protein R3F49_17545 [Planctomycetota bacterium]
MAKSKKSRGPNWAAAAPKPKARAAATPYARAAEELHSAIVAFCATQSPERLGYGAPIELELPNHLDESAEPRLFYAAAFFDEYDGLPFALAVGYGARAFEQVVAWSHARDVDEEGDECPYLLRDASLAAALIAPARGATPAQRRAQIGELFQVAGVPRALIGFVSRGMRTGNKPSTGELALLAAATRSLVGALQDEDFQALPFDMDERVMTSIDLSGSQAEVAWPPIEEEVERALLEGIGDDDDEDDDAAALWSAVDEDTRVALMRRACALPVDGDGDRPDADRSVVLCTDLRPEGDRRMRAALVVSEVGTLRELGRMPLGVHDPEDLESLAPEHLTATLDQFLALCEGGGEWERGLPLQILVEDDRLEVAFEEVFRVARAEDGLAEVSVVLADSPGAATRAVQALSSLAMLSSPERGDAADRGESGGPSDPDRGVTGGPSDLNRRVTGGPSDPDRGEPVVRALTDGLQLSGALGYIEHRSEFSALADEHGFMAFLDDEEVETRLFDVPMPGDEDAAELGLRAFRVLRALAPLDAAEGATDASPWLAPALAAADVPALLRPGLEAFQAATLDMYAPVPGAAPRLRSLTTLVEYDLSPLDSLPQFVDLHDDIVLPLWRVELPASRLFLPAGCALGVEAGHQLKAEASATAPRGSDAPDDDLRDRAAWLLRRSFLLER